MRAWIKAFFAVDNAVNEDTVMGCVFAACAICEGFIGDVNEMTFWAWLGTMAMFFGKNLTKGGK